MNQPSISAKFTGDGSQIRQEIGKIGKGLQDLGKGGSKDVESIGAAFKGLKSSFMEINSASEVVRKAFSMLAGAVDFLAEGEKVGNFAKAFFTVEKNAKQLYDTIKEYSFGQLTETEILKAGKALNDAGIDLSSFKSISDATYKTAQANMEGYGETLTKVLKAVKSGKDEDLAAMGVKADFSKAIKEYAEFLGKSTKALTEEEKQTAKTKEAVKALNDEYGKVDLAETNDEMQKLIVAWDSLKQILAALLVDILDPMIKYMESLGFAKKGLTANKSVAKQKDLTWDPFKNAEIVKTGELVEFSEEEVAQLEAEFAAAAAKKAALFKSYAALAKKAADEKAAAQKALDDQAHEKLIASLEYELAIKLGYMELDREQMQAQTDFEQEQLALRQSHRDEAYGIMAAADAAAQTAFLDAVKAEGAVFDSLASGVQGAMSALGASADSQAAILSVISGIKGAYMEAEAIGYLLSGQLVQAGLAQLDAIKYFAVAAAAGSGVSGAASGGGAGAGGGSNYAPVREAPTQGEKGPQNWTVNINGSGLIYGTADDISSGVVGAMEHARKRGYRAREGAYGR